MYDFFCLLFGSPLTQSSDLTMAELRLELLKEEAKRTSGMSPLSAGDVWSHKVSPSMFFRRAIDLEDWM